MSEQCKLCNEYIYEWQDHIRHHCVTWQFKHEYWGDDWQDRNFKKYWDHEQVAEKIADDSFHDDPGDPNGFEFDVQVKNPKGEVKRFIVTAEPDVIFSAREETDE